MRHKMVGVGLALLVLLLSAVLGATVLREPIAHAATPFTNVIVGNTADQPVPVKQQGTANVSVQGTVPVLQGVPANSFNTLVAVDGGANPAVSGPDPAGTEYAITTFVVSNDGDTGLF